MKLKRNNKEQNKNIFSIKSYITNRDNILIRWSMLLLEAVLLGLQMRTPSTRIFLLESALRELDLGKKPFSRLLRTVPCCSTLQQMAKEIGTLLDFHKVLAMRGDIQKAYPQDCLALDEILYHFSQFKNSISEEQVYFEFSPSSVPKGELLPFDGEKVEKDKRKKNS